MKIVLKRSEVAGKIPSTSDLSLGELAINTTDGTLYTKKSVNGVESVIQVGSASGSGSANPGTGSSNLDPNSPAMNSITPTGYGQHVTLPDGTLMAQAATNIFTIINESHLYNLGVRDSAGTLRRVIPPQGQCNIGLKNKTSANENWTYAMTVPEGAALPIGETYLPASVYPNIDVMPQTRFGNTIVSLASSTAGFTGILTLVAGNLTTGDVSTPVIVVSNDSNAFGAQIQKLSETTGVLIVKTYGTLRMVFFDLDGIYITAGPLYSSAWSESNGNQIEIGQCVVSSSSTFLVTYTVYGFSDYRTYARYFTVTGNTITSTPAATIVIGASTNAIASNRYTELVSEAVFFNYGYAPSAGIFDGYSITIVPPGTVVATGQQAFTNPGTYSFIVPAGVNTISAVTIGGGGGGGAGEFNNGTGSGGGAGAGAGGAGLRWIKDLPVTPGETLTVIVGAAGAQKTTSGDTLPSAGNPSIIRRGANVLVQATGPTSVLAGGTGTALGSGPFGGTIGGGNGGNGGQSGINISVGTAGGGGGAGGYSGNGGNGGSGSIGGPAAAGQGGGGGGGGYSTSSTGGGGGGGVGILGEGANGTAGAQNGGGLYGSSSPTVTNGAAATSSNGGRGGKHGGGGGGAGYNNSSGGAGTSGAIRIIWGANRAYPSTNVDDQTVSITSGNIVVGPQVTMAYAAGMQVGSAANKPPRAARVPNTTKWLQPFIDTTLNAAVQCWIFNGTTLSVGTKLVSSALGTSSSNNNYLTPVAYSSNVMLNCLLVIPTNLASYSILSAIKVTPDGTPSLITTQTVDYVSAFTAKDIITYSNSVPNVVLRWAFSGNTFNVESTTYFSLGDLQLATSATNNNSITTNVASIIPQTRVGQALITPYTSYGLVNVLQDTRIKTTTLVKTLQLPLVISSDAKVGGFGISRSFVGSEALKRATFSALEVVQTTPPTITVGSVNKPSVVSPVSGSTQPDTFLIFSSGFSSSMPDVHMSSDYQIWTGANGTGTKVWDIVGDVNNTVTIRVPLNVLSPNTTYYIRIRQTGASLGASPWSNDAVITTSLTFAPTVAGTAYAGGFYAGRYQIGSDQYAIVVSPRSVEAWTTWGSSVTTSKFDGKANTDASTGPAAVLARAVNVGGFTDWYIGSVYENDLIFSVFKPMAGDSVNSSISPVDNLAYGINSYTVPPITTARTNTTPPQTSDLAWRYGATGTAQTLPLELGSSTVNIDSTIYTWIMQTTTVNGFGSGTVQARNLGTSVTYRPIRRVKLT